MFQKTFSFAGTLLLVGVAVLMMPGLSPAQHGGGHGGGGHGGGGGEHFGGGGAHFAGRGGYFSGAHYGAYRAGMHLDGARYGGSHYGYARYRPYYYGGYGYYPYYGLYGGYSPYYDESYPYLSSSPMYDSAYSNSYGDAVPDFGSGANSPAPAGGYQTLYPSSTATVQPDTVAHLTIKAPADAQVWLDGTPTRARGAVRQFDSPPLAAGKYGYDVQARWIQNDHEVTETRHVEVTPGSRVEMDFPAQPRTPEE